MERRRSVVEIKALENNSNELQIKAEMFKVIPISSSGKTIIGKTGLVLYQDLDVSKFSERRIHKIKNSIEIHRKLYQHTNIIKFLDSYIIDEGTIRVITYVDYLEGWFGTLEEYTFNLGNMLEKSLLTKIITSICNGIQFLHQNKIVHMDLKLSSIFVCFSNSGELISCHIGDLFCASNIEPTPKWLGQPLISAPETERNQYDPIKAEVFSLAFLLWELCSRKPLWREDEIIKSLGLMKEGKRPSTSKISSNWRRLIEECWHQLPDERPSIESIISKFLPNLSLSSPIQGRKTEESGILSSLFSFNRKYSSHHFLVLTPFSRAEVSNIMKVNCLNNSNFTSYPSYDLEIFQRKDGICTIGVAYLRKTASLDKMKNLLEYDALIRDIIQTWGATFVVFIGMVSSVFPHLSTCVCVSKTVIFNNNAVNIPNSLYQAVSKIDEKSDWWIEYGGFKQVQILVVNSIYESEPSSERSQSIMLDRTGNSYNATNSLCQLEKQANITTYGLVNAVVRDIAKLNIPENAETELERSKAIENALITFFALIDRTSAITNESPIKSRVILNAPLSQVKASLLFIISQMLSVTRGYLHRVEDLTEKQKHLTIFTIESNLSFYWNLKCKFLSNSLKELAGFPIDNIFIENSERKVSITDRTDPEYSLMKSTYLIATLFHFGDSILDILKNILTNCCNLTGSEYGYIAEYKGQVDNRTSLANLIKIWCIFEKGTIKPKSELEPILASSNTLCGAAINKKKVVIYTRPSIDETIPDPKPNSLNNCVVIPFLKPTMDLLGCILLGNKAEGFTQDYLDTLKPFFHVCEVLFSAHKIYTKASISDEAKSQLIVKFKHPEMGIVRRDIKGHLKTYKQCFAGKEAVTWLLNNGTHVGITTKEDAIKFGNDLINEKIIICVTNDHKFEDSAYYFYSFAEDEPFQDLNIDRKRGGSFFRTLAEKHKKEKEESEKYVLHAAVKKQDYVKLRKLLSKKKIWEALNTVDENSKSALHLAIESNDTATVEQLLQTYKEHFTKVNIHIKDKDGNTPLHMAAESGNTGILMALLRFPQIQTNTINNKKETAFHRFCEKFSSPSSLPALFDLFISRDTKINALNQENETPLHKSIFNTAVRLLMVPLLIKNGADVNAMNKRGETPLCYAVLIGRKDLVTVLLLAGADPNLKAENGKTAFEIARSTKDAPIIQLLEQATSLNSWLGKIDLRKYLPLFMKERITMENIGSFSEQRLLDMGVSLPKDREKILKAAEKVKREFERKKRKSQEKNEKKEEKSHPPSEPSNSAKTKLGDKKKVKKDAFTRIPPAIAAMKAEEKNNQMSLLKEKLQTTEQVNWLSYSELEFVEELGSGTSGDVYRGYYLGEEVVIKVLERDRETKLEDFKHEFEILTSVRGPNIVTFLGACLENRPCLIMEFCSRGSLYNVLKSLDIQFGWNEFLSWSIQMFNSIQHLHRNKPQILHRDLKTMNFLVTKDWVIKVCDFGLSRFTEQSGSRMSTFYQLRGTMNYCAPETVEGIQYTTKSDIYSLGIILWEMLYRLVTGEYQKPFAEFTYISQPIQIVIFAAQKKLRPTIPHVESHQQPIIDLITQCWDAQPENRPEAEEGLKILEECQRNFELNPEKWTLPYQQQEKETKTK